MRMINEQINMSITCNHNLFLLCRWTHEHIFSPWALTNKGGRWNFLHEISICDIKDSFWTLIARHWQKVINLAARDPRSRPRWVDAPNNAAYAIIQVIKYPDNGQEYILVWPGLEKCLTLTNNAGSVFGYPSVRGGMEKTRGPAAERNAAFRPLHQQVSLPSFGGNEPVLNYSALCWYTYQLRIWQEIRPTWGSNPRPWD